jgi:PleD family two-component response regulator
MSDCPLPAARRVAQKIVDDIAAIRFAWQGQSYQIGASVGVTRIAAGASHPAELMSEADAACYVAKASGRGRVEVYSPDRAGDAA